jgi:hypothetical protein
VPSGAGKVDPRAVGHQRAALGDQLAESGDLVSAGKPTGRSDDPPPRDDATVGGHDCPDGSRAAAAEALNQDIRYGAVCHGPSRWDALHQLKHRLDVFVVHQAIVP